MNIEKTQLKLVLANNLGATLEDRLEGERKAMYELTGASQALKQASRKVIGDLIAKLESEQEGDRAIKDGLEAPLVIQLIKKWLTKAGDFLDHLSTVEQQKAVAQGGRAAGLEDAMKIVSKMRDDEAAKLQMMMDIAKGNEEGLVSEVPRTPAEAARKEHGSASERRAAESHTTNGGASEIVQNLFKDIVVENIDV